MDAHVVSAFNQDTPDMVGIVLPDWAIKPEGYKEEEDELDPLASVNYPSAPGFVGNDGAGSGSGGINLNYQTGEDGGDNLNDVSISNDIEDGLLDDSGDMSGGGNATQF